MFDTTGAPGWMRPPVVVAYGMGLDSTGMILGLLERGLRPDMIVSADTGGEKPQTYQFLFRFDEWLSHQGFAVQGSVWLRPPGYGLFDLPERRVMHAIQVVRNDGRYGTLEQNCLDKAMLPSLAYGGRSCSEKYKLRPQHKWLKTWEPARQWWRLTPSGRRPSVQNRAVEYALYERKVVKLIGYNAVETSRSDISADDFYSYLYPLRVWGWTRKESQDACQRHGLSPPVKSACFFCPGTKKHELIQLGIEAPSLLQRALAMEQRAVDAGNLHSIKGLGRCFSWTDFVKQGTWLINPPEIGCVCHGPVYNGEGIDLDREECEETECQERS